MENGARTRKKRMGKCFVTNLVQIPRGTNRRRWRRGIRTSERLSLSKAASYKLDRVFKNSKLSMGTKMLILNSVVASVLLYGTEARTWTRIQ